MLLPFQILAIVGSATFAGAMLAIGLILGRYWTSLPPAEFLAWFGAHSHLVAQAIPVVVVPTLVGFAGTLWLGWGGGSARPFWLAGLGCMAALLVLTAVYFLPLNARFVARSIPLDGVEGQLRAWLLVHNLRIVLAIAAAALGIVAMTR